MEKRLTFLLAGLLEFLLILFAALLPFAFYCAWKGYALDPGNSLRTFSELVSNSDLILVDLAFVLLFTIARTISLTTYQYASIGISNVTPLSLILCVFEILFVIAATRVELFIYSKILLHTQARRDGFLIKSISASLSVAIVLGSSVLSSLLTQTNSVFLSIACCCLLILFIFGQKALSKNHIGTESFFAQVHLFSEIGRGLLKISSVTLFISFLSYMAEHAIHPASAPSFAFLLALCSVGVYLSVYCLCEEPPLKLCFCFISAISIWFYLYIIF